MRVPMSWLRDYVELPADTDPRQVADRLTAAGLQVERVESLGAEISGVVVAKVLEVEQLEGQKKPIRWVTLTDGTQARQVICGATNFTVGDVVAYARPPATLPGGFEITARKTYGHISDGMICSGRELGISDDHEGILVLAPELALGTDVVTALDLRDDVLDISINPDRGYALSVRGVAREVATAYAVPFHDPAAVPSPPIDGEAYEVRIDAPDGCSCYVARVLNGLDGSVASPDWLKRRLIMAGMRPISLVVDVTNYVMLAVGQPLHAFDRNRLSGPIVVRWARPGERLRTLDDVDRVLDTSDLVITDDTGPIALAGVMGGAATEIRPETTDVVLEAAHFDAVAVSYTARRHRLGSEASRRFERGVDDDLARSAAALALGLLADLGAGTPSDAVSEVDCRSPRPTILIDPELPGRIAGVAYPPTVVEDRLADIGCILEAVPGGLEVTPPSWRPDLKIPVDLVEEVIRLEGYDQLPSTVPRAPAGRGLTRAQRLRRQIGRALADFGLAEVLSSPFVSAGSASQLMVDPSDPRVPSVRIANPVSDEEPFLRTTLLPGLFDALVRNVGRGSTDVALFETGPVFRHRVHASPPPDLPAGIRPSAADLAALDNALPAQPNRVAGVLAGARERPGWWGPGRRAQWSDAIAAVQAAARAVGVPVTVRADPHPPFHPGRSAAMHVGGELLGHAGELHPRVVEAWGLPARTVGFEIDPDVLIAASPEIAAAPVVSPYPPATIDIAVIVAAEMPSATVAAALAAGAGDLLETIRLFDVYRGEQVGEGNKSLAFSLRFRALDRTLTADEAIAARDTAVAEAARACGAVLR